MKKLYFFAVILSLFTTKVHAVDPRLNWKTLETENFYVHFADGYLKLANKAAAVAEKAHSDLSPKLNWQPVEKTHLVISDETDQPNGYALPFPFSRSVLFMVPPDDANTLEDFDSWLETLITHEYVHILHLDKGTGAVNKLRKVFGRHFFLFPNLYQPAWITEGLATYHETDLEDKVGRGQSSVFQMMMRMEVDAGIKPISQVNLPIKSWPMGTVYYLYGVHFFQFLEEQYGKQATSDLVDNYSDNILPFFINSNTEQLFEKDLTELWQEFSTWLEEKYQPQIQQIKAENLTRARQLTRQGYTTAQVKSLVDGRVFYIRGGAFEHAALMSIDQKGKHHFISNVHRSARLDVHETSGALIAQQEFCDEYNFNFDLYIIEHGKKEPRRLTQCARYRSVAWSDDGENIVAVHTDKAISQLHLLDQQGENISVVYQGKEEEIIGQPDWSPDGNTIVASVFRPSMGWNIELFDINNKQWTLLTNDRNIDLHPEFSADGSSILFSSERNGVYNIHQLSLQNNSLHQLTNVIGGAFEPSQAGNDGALYYVGYHANGRDIFQLNNINKLSTEILEIADYNYQISSPIVLPAHNVTNYSPWPGLKPRWWSPLLVVDEDNTEIGISSSANDALGIHNYLLDAAYDTENEWFIGGLSYAYSNRFSFGYRRSTDILRDQNNNFAMARKEDDLFALAIFNYPGVDASQTYVIGATTSTENDGRIATGIAPLGETKDRVLGLSFQFNNADNYIRSISPADGRSVRLMAESSDVWESDFSGEVYTLDWREFLSLGEQHVLALRFVEAWGTENPEQFNLGGEDTDFNAFDLLQPVGEPVFGERDYALRGYPEGLQDLRGRRMQLGSIEWRFPFGLVENGWMAPPIGLIQWSGSLFMDSGATWNDGSSPEKYYTSAGFEIHGDVNLFYSLTTRMRLGVATGLDDTLGDDRVYFSLGASF
ncbi:MAG: hypothetical protein OQL06_14125 [Gammaproteobacteria bacterium]|nr:hypothetical protein [Gammaproteobacteria bacterium]